MGTLAKLGTRQNESNRLENFNEIGIHSKRCFKFYNNWNLAIMVQSLSKGKLIFLGFFKKLSSLATFSFLDEKSLLKEEYRLSTSLSVFHFFKALYVHLKIKNQIRYVSAFLIVVTYLVLSNWNEQLAAYFSYSVVIIGLLYIGIPHGALDHLLSKNRSTPLFVFIFKYLFISALYYAFWQYFPFLALLVFVSYTSFHFGESELVETEKSINSLNTKLKAFLMGFSILFFIILSHAEESLGIVSNFIEIRELVRLGGSFSFIAVIGTILTFVYILTQSIMSKRWCYLGLLFLLLLGIRVPLILAFSLYFIFQHSSNAWQHLKRGLNMNSFQLYKKSSLYTLGALVIFILIAFCADEILSINGLLAKFFLFIACISLPHFILMHLFYKANLH